MGSTSTIVDDGDAELCCSDDILKEILFRLPLKSVFRSKCVSKRWNHLISDPCFASTYASLRGTSALHLGFFVTPTMTVSSVTSGRPKWAFLPTLQKEKEEGEAANIINSLESSQANLDGYFICSSNGLFLICSRPPITTYYIHNPLTRESYKLPPSPLIQQQSLVRPFMSLVVTTTVDNDNVYKVVRAGIDRGINGSIVIEIFSSMTGEWRQSTVTVTDETYDYFLRPMIMKTTVIRGSIYWMSDYWMSDYYSSILVYDPYKKDEHIEMIKNPLADSRFDIVLGESTDGLLQMARLNVSCTLIDVWVYSREYRNPYYDGWSLRRKLQLSLKPSLSRYLQNIDFRSNIRCLRLVAFHPHNPEAVFINFNGVIFQCYFKPSSIDARIEAVQFRDDVAEYSNCLQPYFLPLWPISPLPLLELKIDSP
ncbi:F-box protein At5g03970-like [Macadamia integrifolia]|uniref:F-box protein At5g03970-like n=1 Tax=Macadamia integrifolia TaxID=60698 RepID=UPI001C4EBDC8|nr:F-box protein At5g03970-like [Macadamia integrifolia]